MALTRISTYAQHQSTLRDMTQVQTRLIDLQNQISSGLKTPNFAGIAGEVEMLAAIEHKISRTRDYVDNNSVTLTRLTTTRNAIDAIIQVATDLRNQVLLRRNASFGNHDAFRAQVESGWRQIVGQLNVTSSGRHVFSGTRTDSPAVDDSSVPTLAVVGIADDGYYLGSKENVTARLQEDYDLELDVRADNEAFQNLMAGIAMAMQGNEANDDASLVRAYDMLSGALDGATSLQATVNADIVAVNQINEQHDAQRLYWQSVKEDLVNTDLVAAATEVARNQGLMQASFQIFARISALRLSDYLR